MLAKIKSSSAKRAKLKITTGVVHISSTFNNTIVTITDTKGNTIAWSSAGATGFKGARLRRCERRSKSSSLKEQKGGFQDRRI